MPYDSQSPHGEPDTDHTSPSSQASDAGEADGVDWKAMARKWEARAKRSHTRIAQLEADAKTHAGQVKEAVEAAEAPLRERIGQLEHAEQPRARATQAATEANVPVELLRGETLEELTDHAKLISKAIKAARNSQRVVEHVEQTPTRRGSDAAAFARALFGSTG